MSKGLGQKIAIKFDSALVGDVSGITPTPVGGFQYFLDVPKGGLTYSASNVTYGAIANAFDGSTSTMWGANTAAAWARVDFGAGNGQILNKTRWYTTTSHAPRAYVIEGSNDATSWDTLASGESANSTGWKEHEFENTNAYRYYQFRTTTGWSTRCYVYEFEYYKLGPVGNEQAFTIEGKQPLYTKIPSEELGPLIDGSYAVESVVAHPTEPNTILLTMTGLGKFRNLEDDLTVKYDMSKGNLAGLGGAVLSFEEPFTPEDLERMIHPLVEENISAEIVALELNFIPVVHVILGDGPYPNAGMRNEEDYQGGIFYAGTENNETITASITDLEIDLIHVNDLDP